MVEQLVINLRTLVETMKIKSNVGKSTTTRAGIDFTGKITEIDGTEVKKESFYTNTLTWDNQHLGL